MGALLYLPKSALYHTVHISSRRHPIEVFTALLSSPLLLSYMCKAPDSILRLSLGLEPVVSSPYCGVYCVGPNLTQTAFSHHNTCHLDCQKRLSASPLAAFVESQRCLTSLDSLSYETNKITVRLIIADAVGLHYVVYIFAQVAGGEQLAPPSRQSAPPKKIKSIGREARQNQLISERLSVWKATMRERGLAPKDMPSLTF